MVLDAQRCVKTMQIIVINFQTKGFIMIKSPLSGWVGGKFHLAKSIIPLIPNHDLYTEVFAGAAWVLFRKPHSKVEVINDINSDVVTLYRVVQHHLDEFVRYFRWSLYAREEFDRWWKVPPETLTDIQRAARFFYIQKASFGGKITPDATFGISRTRTPRLNLTRLEEDLSAAHLRLQKMYIENLGYNECIARYDTSDTFFYLDPPYWGCTDYYGKELFSERDFTCLSEQLAKIKGKFLFSINDTPEIRELYNDFTIEEVDTIYSLQKSKSKRVKELLIRNY